MAYLTVTMQVDGVDYAAAFPEFTSDDHIREVWFGIYNAFNPVDFDIRNIKVGTTGFGSSNVWAPALSSTANFDAIYGAGSGLTVSAGVLTVANSGTDRYGVKNLGADYTDLYVQFDVRMRPAMIGVYTGSFHVISVAGGGAAGSESDGLFGEAGDWSTDIGDTFGTGPVANTWITLGVRWRYGPAVTLTPDTGVPADLITASGVNFAASSALTATFNSPPAVVGFNVPLFSVTATDPDGTFAGSQFLAPPLEADTYEVAFKDASANIGTAIFAMQPSNIPPITVGDMVGENDYTGATTTLDLTLTEDVPRGDPQIASWLLVFTAAMKSPRTGINLQPTITDNATVGAPYYQPNRKVDMGFGAQYYNDYNLTIDTYLILNDLHSGDVITLTTNMPVSVISARVHHVTGLNYPEPQGALIATLPNPPYSLSNPRPSGIFQASGYALNANAGPTQKWVSDLTVFFSEALYTGAPPTLTFADFTYLGGSTFTVPEQFAFELQWDVNYMIHGFYAFSNFALDVFQRLKDYAVLPGGVAGGLGYIMFHAGPGVPYPPAEPTADTGVFLSPHSVTLGNETSQ